MFPESVIPASGGRRPLQVAAAVLGLLLIALAIWKRLRFLGMPIGSFDEGVFLTNADLLLRGQAPFRDYYSIYPPGIYLLLAGLWRLFGVSVLTERLLAILLALGIAGMIGRHAGKLVGRSFSWLASGLGAYWLIPLGDVAYAWLAALFLILLATDLAAASTTMRRQASAGVLLGVAAIFRHDVSMYVIGLWSLVLLVSAWNQPGGPKRYLRALVPPLVASMVAIALWIPVLAIGGAHNVWSDLVVNVKIIMPARTLPTPNVLALWKVPFLPIFAPALLVRSCEAGIVLCYVAPLAALLYLRRLWRAGSPATLRAALIFGLAIAVLPQMSFRTDLPHVLQSLAPALVLVSAWIEDVIARPGSSRPILAAALVGLICLPPVIPTLEVPLRLTECATACTGLPREGGLPQTSIPTAQARKVVAAEVARYTKPGDPIFVGLPRHDRVYVNEMDLYFLLERTGGSRFMQFDPNLTTRLDVQQKIVDDLKRRQVRVVILNPGPPLENQPGVLPGSGYLDAFLAAEYAEVRRIGTYSVRVRKDLKTSS
jgi:hypothetical protein